MSTKTAMRFQYPFQPPGIYTSTFNFTKFGYYVEASVDLYSNEKGFFGIMVQNSS
jgi:hypothetical protein